MTPPPAPERVPELVLDTNIVLDVFVFDDAAARPLREALASGGLRWLATQAMRDELDRVLAYPQIAARLAFHQRPAGAVLQSFDELARLVPAPAKAPVTCKDPDDQKFIDLAVTARCLLLSKDAAVLAMRRRMQALGAAVAVAWSGSAIF